MSDQGAPPKPWEQLYQAVGECLHAWSNVETDLTTLFVVLHDRPWNDFRHPLRAAFEAIISLEGRVGMIAATVSADPKMTNNYSDHWKKLQSKILKSYRKRHEVAHFTSVSRAKSSTSPQMHFIRPFFKYQEFMDNSGTELDLKQINERTLSFFRLSDRVRQHTQYVGIKRGLPTSHFTSAGHIAYPDLDAEDEAT